MQLLVYYQKDDGARVGYDTAYTSEQWRRSAAACYRAHGNAVIARADLTQPEDLST